MKNLISILSLISVIRNSVGQQNIFPCQGQSQQVIFIEDASCLETEYVLAFEDNFEGNLLDLTKWGLPYQGVSRDFDYCVEKQWYMNTGSAPSIPFTNNIEVSNGTLKLITRKENPPITGTYVTDFSTTPYTFVTESFDYSSAEIHSKYKFHYGKYEIRCKIPKGRGFFPAFWMYGVSDDNVSNEIDVFEFDNDNTNDHNMTLHYDNEQCRIDYNGPDYSQEFHTFTLIWSKYLIRWFVDGDLKRTTTKYNTMLGQQVDCSQVLSFTQYLANNVYPKYPVNIITNLAIQHINTDCASGSDYEPDETTPFPSSLEIDYIRFYEAIPCYGPIYINDNTELNLSNEVYNLIIGTTITVDGDVSVSSGQQSELRARDEIELVSGFYADAGSNFLAQIDPTICAGKSMYQNNMQTNSDTIDILAESDVRIAKSLENQNIKIYPNPSNGKLLIEIKDLNLQSFKIYLLDENGSILNAAIQITDKITEIELNKNLSKGTYLLKIVDKLENTIFINKIILQ